MNETTLMTTEELVIEATFTARHIKEMTCRLETVKAEIRQRAERIRQPGDTNIEFDSVAGTAMVTFPKARLVLTEGADPGELKDVLPRSVWNALFLVKVVINTQTCETVLEQLRGKEKRLTLKVLSHVPSTPAVILPR